MRIRLSYHVTFVLLTTLAACDNRQLTGPNVRSPRLTVSEPIGLGSGFMQVPPTSSPSDLTNLPYEDLGIAVPESTWVVVRVSGSLGMRWNTEGCAMQPPFWQCADNPPFLPYGPDPGTQGGPVQLFKADGSFTAIGLRGSGESAIGIFYQNQPGPLVGHLNLSPVYAWNPINGGNTPSWFLSGGYTVTATAVPAPFTVTESAPDADGIVTYTAEPLDGLQFSNPPPYGYFPPGYIVWAFYPGDSLPDRPDRTWPGWGVPQCELSPVCQYKPPVPGRMQVTAFVEWRSATTRSKPAPLCVSNQNRSVRASASGSSGCTPQPTLRVECTPADTVLALNPVRCQAIVDPSSAALTVSSWQFVGDSLGVKLSQTGDSIAWTFRPMVCGTVTVAGLVDGVPQSASRHIDVECNMLQAIPADPTDSMLLNNRAVQRAM
ncbi:MAG TPA: hypothetical protein VFJ82_15120, partial [Longimicrobium sp.]|nr:hypothetical protein [Longimicrobium sp.]